MSIMCISISRYDEEKPCLHCDPFMCSPLRGKSQPSSALLWYWFPGVSSSVKRCASMPFPYAGGGFWYVFLSGALAECRFAPDLRREQSTNQAIARPMANASGIPTPSPTVAPMLRDGEELGVAIAIEGDVAITVVAVIVVIDVDVAEDVVEVVGLELVELELVELELVLWLDCVVILNEGDVKGIPKSVPL